MKQNVAAFAVGFLFAIGLGLSGMTKPQNVIGFLDIFDSLYSCLLRKLELS